MLQSSKDHDIDKNSGCSLQCWPETHALFAICELFFLG